MRKKLKDEIDEYLREIIPKMVREECIKQQIEENEKVIKSNQELLNTLNPQHSMAAEAYKHIHGVLSMG